MLKLAIAGADGRMGRMLIEAALASDDLAVAAALEQPGGAAIGRDCADVLGRRTGVAVTADLAQIAGCDVLIDFTRPAGTLAHLAQCVRHRVAAVIGTTGFDDAGRAAIAAAAVHVPIVFSPNMSIGVNAAFKLLEVAGRLLGDDWDVEVVEAHHKHKVDAPSGTALKMGEMVAHARGVALRDVAVLAREGVTGERQRGTIGFAAVRGGDIVGDHTVMFCGPGERIEITHRSGSRAGYAAGSLQAARFVAGRSPGLFDMFDVLGLRT